MTINMDALAALNHQIVATKHLCHSLIKNNLVTLCWRHSLPRR